MTKNPKNNTQKNFIWNAIVATIIAIILIPLFEITDTIYSFLISSVVLIVPYLVLLQIKLQKVNNVK